MVSRPEITAGLKNAVERGYPLEFAKQSFINAGYSKQDVDDSAKSISISSSMTQPVQNIKQEEQIKQIIRPTPQIQPRTQPIEKTEFQNTSTKTQKLPQAQKIQETPQMKREELEKQSREAPKTEIKHEEFIPPSQPPIQQLKKQENQEYKPRKSKMWVVVIILAIILILAVAGLLITLFRKDWILSIFESLGLINLS